MAGISARVCDGMLRAGGPHLRLHPLLAIFPGLMIMLAVLGFNAMGDAIRDILTRAC